MPARVLAPHLSALLGSPGLVSSSFLVEDMPLKTGDGHGLARNDLRQNHLCTARDTGAVIPAPSRLQASCSRLLRILLVRINQGDAIHAAACQNDLAVACCRHVANYSAPGRDRPGLKLFDTRVKTHERVGFHA